MAKKRNSKKPGSTARGKLKVGVEIPLDWIPQLDALAEHYGLSRADYIRDGCRRKMDADLLLQVTPSTTS